MSAATYLPALRGETASRDVRVTGGRIVRSEWIKFSSLRSTWYTFGVAAIGMVGIEALVTYLTNERWAQMRPIEIATFDPTARSLAGVYLAQLAIGVLGVLIFRVNTPPG